MDCELYYAAGTTSTAKLSFLKEIDWQKGIVQTCIVGESGLIKQLLQFSHWKRLTKTRCLYLRVLESRGIEKLVWQKTTTLLGKIMKAN